MDLDVNNYTTEELTALIGITGELSITEIKEAIRQQKVEHPSKKSAAFFDAIEEKLVSAIDEIPVQKTIEVEVKKGTINPDLKTTITRLINIDSAYRSRDIATNSVDKFVFELSEPLLNVVSLSFYSLELPQSWWTISNLKGTDSFLLYVLNGTPDINGNIYDAALLVQIAEGNYTTEGLCRAVIDAINAAIVQHNIDYPTNAFQSLVLLGFNDCYNQTNGKFSFKFTSDATLPGPVYTIQLIWYDERQREPKMSNNRYDYHLGWLLGTRFPLTTVRYQGINPIFLTHLYENNLSSLVDATGTKYIIIAIDDFKTNRLNRAIVSISNKPNTKMALPTYFSQDVPMYKVSPTKTNAIQSNPRNLTMKQIYTINAIMDKTIPNDLITPYDSSDSFAKISVKRTDWGKTVGGQSFITDLPNKLFVENGGPLQLQSREYFGPVDISTMSISLHDDKGNLLGMNGMDWSISIMAKCIYQY